MSEEDVTEAEQASATYMEAGMEGNHCGSATSAGQSLSQGIEGHKRR